MKKISKLMKALAFTAAIGTVGLGCGVEGKKRDKSNNDGYLNSEVCMEDGRNDWWWAWYCPNDKKIFPIEDYGYSNALETCEDWCSQYSE